MRNTLTLAFILLVGTGLFFWQAGFFSEEECIVCHTTKSDHERYIASFYNDGWHDGYEQAREDIEKLEECKNQEYPTMEECLNIFLQEDYDFYYRAYRQGLLPDYYFY